jgi:hypothetical protein
MSNSLTVQDLTALVVSELAPWDCDYDIEAIVLELDDSYHVTTGEIRFEDIPDAEFTDVCHTYDRNLI